MRTAIASPEPRPDPWDPETLAAWQAWKALSELAWPEMPESHTREVFWGIWDQTARFASRRGLFRYISLLFYDLSLSRDQYPKWHIVNEWMRETRDMLDAEAARERTLGGPESWDSEARSAWEAWMRLWELTAGGRCLSLHKEIFWRYWRGNSRLEALKLLHGHVMLSIRAHDATNQIPLKCDLLGSWLRHTENRIACEEKRRK